jgi:uncharacterized protein YgbK (DUF1537 family)
MIGIIADDITGANDIGIMYAKANITTHVYPMEAWTYQSKGMQPEVLVLDTHSRLDTPEEAYNKVFQMTTELKEAGVARFINKRVPFSEAISAPNSMPC